MKMLHKSLLPAIVFLAGACAVTLSGTIGSKPPPGSQYLADVNPSEAYQILEETEGAVLLDIRTQAEYYFLGHPPGAVNIPSEFWDEKNYQWTENTDFTARVEKRFPKETPIIFMCRSGSRSQKAANKMAGLGFTKAYNMVESFEGDKDPRTGYRTVNGWKNRGLPYTYNMDPELMYWP